MSQQLFEGIIMEMTGAFKAYDVFSLEGQLKIDSIPLVSPKLQSHIQANPEKDLVLDLSNTGFMDSSGIRLLVNIKKKKEATKKKLYILSPSDRIRELFQNVNLLDIMDIVDSCEQVHTKSVNNQLKKYESFAHAEGDLLRLDLSCPLCNSCQVAGYSINPHAYTWEWGEWKWDGDELFPVAKSRETGSEIDFFALHPIICTQCLLCSTDNVWFNAVKDDTTPVESGLDIQLRSKLTKAAKERGRIAQTNFVISDSFFDAPRDSKASFLLYALAADCAECLPLQKNMFIRGYYHYCSAKYAHSSALQEIFGKARTWLAGAINDSESYSPSELAKIFFMAMNTAYYLNKENEASSAYDRLTSLAGNIRPGLMPSFDDPHFWYSQAGKIREKRGNTN
ncbi:MAG: anti-sigma factor antagonist [Chitinivibrionales bacterium]|nr:anti-sigma factor antagonist [Chitinivibrionales bacterium]